MERTLREHIARLEEKIRIPNSRANDIDCTPEDRYDATVELSIAEQALNHFRKAVDFEQKILS